MRRPVRLTSIVLASLMLQSALVPAFGQVKLPYGSEPGGDTKAPAPVAQQPRAMPPAPPAAPAQAALQPGVAEEELVPTADDPPIVVGRIARSTGEARFRLPNSEEWLPADLNTTLTTGAALWTEQGARLALEVARSRLFLEGDTAVQLDELDEDGMRATIAQGSGFLRVQGVATDDGVVQVATPEATLATVADGRYLIEAAAPDGSRPGRIAVFEGAAEVTPAGAEPVSLAAGEALLLAPGAAPQRVEAGAATPLMAWALSLEPRRTLPPSVAGMTGVADLAAYGSWGSHAEYGEVWYPPVQPGWQPYRDGTWQWREPWGWVWVDAAPWGYAPAHYGRWVQVGPRWAWAPRPVHVVGYQLRPAWAPALVAFFGGVVVGRATRPVGWVPLAPREPYYPWYRASPRYVQRVNYRQVTNVTVVRNVWIERGGRDYRWDRPRDAAPARFYDRRLDEFRHRHAAIQVPERVMLASQPVRPEARRLQVQDARRAELLGGLPLRPAPETRGVTPRSAERLGFSPEERRATEERRRVQAPPPAVRAALEPRRREDPRPRAESPREAGPTRRDPLPGADRRDAPGPTADRSDRADRQALRERLMQQQQQRPPGSEPRRAQADDPRPALREDTRRGQQQDQFRQQQQDRLRRQQQDQAREQQDQLRRRQQDEARQQQQDQLRRQQQDQARRQQEQMGRQQEQMRQQRQDQARQQQEQMRQQRQDQARQQQQEQARQQQEQMRRQQQEQARQQRQEQARQQQEQMRRYQQEQMRQQQEQARRQQAEQRRQERQR